MREKSTDKSSTRELRVSLDDQDIKAIPYGTEKYFAQDLPYSWKI